MAPKIVAFVDDSRDDLFLFETACRVAEVGFKAIPIEGGMEAVEYLDRAGKHLDLAFPEPDLLVVDLKMPSIDGFDLLHRIRTDPEHVNLPVAVMTCSCLQDDIERANELGATWYFIKPLGLEGLIDLVRRLDQCLSDPDRCGPKLADLSKIPAKGT